LLKKLNKEYHIKTKQYFTKAEKEIRTNELEDIESPWKLDKNLETHVAGRRSIRHQRS